MSPEERMKKLEEIRARKKPAALPRSPAPGSPVKSHCHRPRTAYMGNDEMSLPPAMPDPE